MPETMILSYPMPTVYWLTRPRLTEDTWCKPVRERLRSLAWEQVVADGRPFLEPGADPGLLTLDNLMRVLE